MQDKGLQIEIGHRSMDLREKFGYTREDLAEKLGISWQHLSNIEKGRRGVSVDLLLQLKTIFQVKIDYLVSGCDANNDTVFLYALLTGADPAIYPYIEDSIVTLIKACNASSKSHTL